jgi:hypothetical protein
MAPATAIVAILFCIAAMPNRHDRSKGTGLHADRQQYPHIRAVDA